MEGNKYITSPDWELLAKYLCNETSESEKADFELWLSKSEENRFELERHKKLLQNSDFIYQSKQYNNPAAWEKVYSQITKDQPVELKRIKLYSLLKYAAIIILFALIGSIGYFIINRNSASDFQQITSIKNQVDEVLLPDGTIVTLNSNTKLTFTKQFSGKTREVMVVGEAFFEVEPNPSKPFIINAGKARIRVLGTSFNVCAYPESKTVEITVETGKVQVANFANRNEKQVYLDPGEKATLFNKSNLLQKSLNKNPNYYSWKTHNLIFNESKLKEVIKCLEKTYHVKIILNENELNNLSYTAHFSTQPIDYILEVMRLTFNLKLTYENDQYVLESRN